jgi:hypothetical protein
MAQAGDHGGFPARVGRMASRAPTARRRPVSTKEIISAWSLGPHVRLKYAFPADSGFFPGALGCLSSAKLLPSLAPHCDYVGNVAELIRLSIRA